MAVQAVTDMMQDHQKQTGERSHEIEKLVQELIHH